MVDHLRYPAKRLGSVAPWIEFQDGLSTNEGIGHLHPLRNNDVTDQRAAYPAELGEGFARMSRSRHLDRQNRGDPQPGIESLLDSLDRGKEATESPEREETTFGRHNNLVGGDKRVDGQNTQGRRTVYQNEVSPGLEG
jgi:hypothetical protein